MNYETSDGFTYSTLSLGSVPCLRTEAIDTERPVLSTHPEPCIIFLKLTRMAHTSFIAKG
jgi:hypothetical protein